MVNETHTMRKTVFFALLLVISTSAVCRNTGYESGLYDEPDSLVFANPIDSLVYYMEQERDEDDYIDFNRDPRKVYEYLMAHPDFVKNSDSIGHKNHRSRYETYLLWKDCGDIRIYSIPYETFHGIAYRTIVQYKEDCRVDTSFFEEEIAGMEDIYQIVDRKGKKHYFLITRYYYEFDGDVLYQGINAFSVENGDLVDDSVFYKDGKFTAGLGEQCGDMAEPILVDLEGLSLVYFIEADDYYPPRLIIAETTPQWPTGKGFRYRWNGFYFEYVGIGRYNCNGVFSDF